MSEKLFKAGQSLTRAYKKFDDFAQKGLITTLKDRFKKAKAPVLSKSKAVTVFDPKKALPSKLPSAAKKVGKLGTLKKVGRVASRVALPVAAGFEAANLAYKVATLSPEKKAKVKKLKTTLKKKSTKTQHADLLKMRLGGDTMKKKIPEGPKGEGLRKLKAERPDVTRKMGFAKKGKMLKAKIGKMMTFKEYVREKRNNAQIGPTEEKNLKREYIKKIRGAQVGPAEEAKLMGNMKSQGGEMRGFGAARTSGMGLQDESLPAGKSLDYYKDIM